MVENRFSSSAWPWLIPLVFATVIIIPVYVFFSGRGGFDFLAGRDLRSFSRAIFPLVGLYAFTLVWLQLMIGTNINALRRVFPWIETWHRTEGVFTFLFAVSHPALLLIGVGWTDYQAKSFVDPKMVPYVWLGTIQLGLLCLTVGTALLRRTRWLRNHWRKIHYLNYLIFISVWIHSWFLGSDVQSTSLRYLWIFFAATAVLSTVARIIRRRPSAVSEPIPAAETGFVTVAGVDQVTAGHPACVVVNGQKIAVLKFDDRFYAIDNTCSHAGGSLCEGIQLGNKIECPLHQSLFDITTGAVKAGPATRPQRTYEVKVNGSEIKIKI